LYPFALIGIQELARSFKKVGDPDLYADYYRNKLYKFRQGTLELGGSVSVLVPPGKISLRGPAVA